MTFSRWLQSRLTAHGYPCGQIDGIVGPITTAALRAFQRARGLIVTGTATPETVTSLRLSSTATVTPIPERNQDVPELDQPAPVWPRQGDVQGFFGKVGERQTRVHVPWAMRLAWDKNVRISRITLHERVAASAERALQKIARTYSAVEISDLGLDLFGGSLNVRRMRGGTRYSMHSWGIAIDFDPERNQLRWTKPQARLSRPDAVPFWRAWEAEGWVSLGRARDFDWMHVQAARL
ncbi:peptidoglycan-binding protein [Oceaniglobus ichthyenteri]|uniref:peptidoglycan-binding protein n=1 Tax=Oceaniglobus ichthyenteri TaxID=2136177 RepID=UPI000D388660|nr:peptidoglycan-binding protein [Oceaniglobus ichthyenteri]